MKIDTETSKIHRKSIQNLNAPRAFLSSLVLKFHFRINSRIHSRIHFSRVLKVDLSLDLRIDLRFDFRLDLRFDSGVDPRKWFGKIGDDCCWIQEEIWKNPR